MKRKQSSVTWIWIAFAADAKIRFETSNYEVKGPLIGKNKKITVKKDELSGKIMKKLVSLRPKMYISHTMVLLTRNQSTQRNVF